VNGCEREHRYAVQGSGKRASYEKPDIYDGPDLDAAVSAAVRFRSDPQLQVTAYHPTFLAYVHCEAGTRQVNDAVSALAGSAALSGPPSPAPGARQRRNADR
jgi:hypothetical protein